MLELLVDVFDVLALLVEVLEGVYGAPNVMLGVGNVDVESSCAKNVCYDNRSSKP